jgi:hypothetical protein
MKQHWGQYEPEVSHYFQHEPGKASSSMDPDSIVGHSSEPNPPRWPSMTVELPNGKTKAVYADHWTMRTVFERMRVADRLFMPFRGSVYSHGQCVLMGEPSCSMVLCAAYGTKACKYDDSAPNGAEYLKRAKEAYMKAALQVPWQRGPSAKERIARSWKAAFG